MPGRQQNSKQFEAFKCATSQKGRRRKCVKVAAVAAGAAVAAVAAALLLLQFECEKVCIPKQ